MITVVGTADWHADEFTWKDRPTLCGDAQHSLKQIVDHAIRVEAQVLIGAGDLFDSVNPSPVAQAYVHRELDRLMEHRIDVLFVDGQHERHSRLARLSVHPWPKSLHGAPVYIYDKTRIVGLNWQPTQRLAESLRALPPSDLLVCHQVWAEFMGDICTPEGTLADCPSSTVLTGDYHKHLVRDVKSNVQPGEMIKVFSPGSISMREISEDPQKAFFVLQFDSRSGRLQHFESVPLQTRKFLRVEVDDEGALQDLCEDADQICAVDESLPEPLRKMLLRVTYYDDTPGAYARLQQTFRERSHLFLQMRTRAAQQRAPQRAATSRMLQSGLLGCLPRVLAENTSEYQTARRLLEAADTKEELAAIAADWLSAGDSE